MPLDGLPVVRPDVDVDADHLSFAEELEHRRHEDDRAAARDTCFDDHVRPRRPDDLLRRHDVGGELDDRHAHPGPEIAVVVLVEGAERLAHLAEYRAVATETRSLPALVVLKGLAVVFGGHRAASFVKLPARAAWRGPR